VTFSSRQRRNRQEIFLAGSTSERSPRAALTLSTAQTSMTMTSVEPSPLVLLAASDRSRERHKAATSFLNEDERRLAVSPQIVSEYLAVSTRPVEANGLGLSGRDAVSNVEQFADVMKLLGDSPATTEHLLDLVGQRYAVGKQVHDANIVAVALAHRATAIVTDDAHHFARFARLLAIEALGDHPH